MKQNDFKVEYQYLPSKQSKAKLQKAFEIIFEKIIKPSEENSNVTLKNETEHY